MYWSSLQPKCEAAGMRISTSKSEAMVLDRKRVACPLRVGGEVLPQVEEFKYLGVLFTSEGKMECEIDRRIGAASAVMRSVYRTDRRGEEGAESKGKAVDRFRLLVLLSLLAWFPSSSSWLHLPCAVLSAPLQPSLALCFVHTTPASRHTRPALPLLRQPHVKL
ncbi:hypothetical protein L3Q82_005522 [Scortum barcoo]|uniref:Uncharacterized protein n=1 Tax=Scortum barcoo TaxID=214431 RepID=A0ACB8VAH7_9TELE|nr:hypothetical protein L3Q82_005522 [Scortum barcoo]